MQSRRNVRLALAVPLAALIFAACSPASHEERVAKLRSHYKARLIGFIVKAEPVLEAPAAEAEDGAESESPTADVSPAAADPASAEEMEPEVAMTPVRQDIAIDILLQHDSPEKLPGITLDIEMVDAAEKTKNTWKVWVDTATLPKATGTQFTHLLEDVDYEEGDGFNVEVRSPVPPEERSEYREFSAPAAG